MTEIVKRSEVNSAMLEQVVVGGNLAQLAPAQRLEYYSKVCESVGLNPLTRPFDYITLNGKLTLYAKKDATDQLRKIHSISISKPEIEFLEDVLMVSVTASDATGRTDSDVGVVTVGNLKGDNKANAIMKAITKAKRRVTLSMAGLGWLDESEIETIRDARMVVVDTDTGEIIEPAQKPATHRQPPQPSNHTVTHRNGAQRPPAQPTEDVNYYDPEQEWNSMAAEADANKAADVAASAPFEWPRSREAIDTCTGFINAPDLGEQVFALVSDIQGKHKDSPGPMSEKQYPFLAGLLNKRYGENSHNAILSALTGTLISGENPPGWKAKVLIDWLKEGTEEVDNLDAMVDALKQDIAQFAVA